MGLPPDDAVATRRRAAIVGCLLGTAVGDAWGLPYEGLSRARAARLLGPPDRYRLWPNRGLVSDDTEHACLVAQALLSSRGEPLAFQHALSWGLRRWVLGAPAGIGLATLRATLKLWCGFSADRSGVWSAGNGPAMRAAILGVSVDDLETLRVLVRSSSRLTHTDPKAEWGAWCIAWAARHAARQLPLRDFLPELSATLPDEAKELLHLVGQAARAAEEGISTVDFAASQGWSRGVSGYIYHTVPVALHAWMSAPHDYASAVRGTIECGGDTDTVAAIAGGIVGAGVGQPGIPAAWLERYGDWPRTIAWLTTLGEALADQRWGPPPRLAAIPLLARNVGFAALVLCHGFRRLLLPWRQSV